ncbi:two-component system response regulator, partial [Acinetobacter baumannii]
TLSDTQVRAHVTRELVPGMLMSRNLTANNGMLLLNAGKVLNLALIEKLIAFEAIEGGRYTLFVRLPESTT